MKGLVTYIPAVLHCEHTLVAGAWLVQAVSEVIPTCNFTIIYLRVIKVAMKLFSTCMLIIHHTP